MEEEWDQDDEQWSSPQLCIGPEGLRIMAEQCSTCIFRPGNPMHLNPGRVKGMVEDVVRDDSFTQCHQTLGCKPGDGALCAGMTERHAGQLVRIFERMGFTTYVQPTKETR